MKQILLSAVLLAMFIATPSYSHCMQSLEPFTFYSSAAIQAYRYEAPGIHVHCSESKNMALTPNCSFYNPVSGYVCLFLSSDKSLGYTLVIADTFDVGWYYLTFLETFTDSFHDWSDAKFLEILIIKPDETELYKFPKI